MRWIVLASDELKDEFLAQGLKQHVEIAWIKNRGDFLNQKQADVFFDLEFENKAEEIDILKQLFPKPVIINNPLPGKEETSSFINILAWPTFLKRQTIEVSAPQQHRKTAEEILACLNRKVDWCNDMQGFISARVIAMIINEAYMALEENVSTKDEIDTAMKLGTNYPYGPFEWVQKIGPGRVVMFLEYLSKADKKYEPGLLLKKEINKN